MSIDTNAKAMEASTAADNIRCSGILAGWVAP
jgi:hypothetical protein